MDSGVAGSPFAYKPLAELPKPAGISLEARFWLLTAAMVAPMFCDGLLVPLTKWIKQNDYAAVIVYACAGLIGAQGTVLAIAHVLGPGSILSRSLFAWSLGALAIGLCLVGLVCAERWPQRNELKEILGGACFVPFFALAVQTPLWIARLTLGWRLTHAEQDNHPPTSLADFFSVTTLVAVTFALVQLGQSWMHSEADRNFWPAVGIAWAVVAGVSAIALLPLIWLSLRQRAALASGVFALTAAAALFYWMSLSVGLRRWRWDWEMTGFTIVYLAIAGGIFAGLCSWQRFGWRLSIGRREATEP